MSPPSLGRTLGLVAFMTIVAAAAPALADSHGYRAGCFEDEPGPAREWTLDVAVGFEVDPDGGRRVVRRPVEMRFPAICTDSLPPLDRTGLTFEADIGGRCISEKEAGARRPFLANVVHFSLDVYFPALAFETYARIYEPFVGVVDEDVVHFVEEPRDHLGLYPLKFWMETSEPRELEGDVWFAKNDTGQVVGHIRCTRPGKARNPICRQMHRFGQLSISSTYNRAALPRWQEIRSQSQRYFECAAKTDFPGVR